MSCTTSTTSENSNFIYIASFDIGKKNFAFYVEKINLSSLESLKNISKLKRYNPNGTPTPEFSELLYSVFANGEKILLKNTDITDGADKTKYFDLELCYNLVDLLDEYEEYWNMADYFVIEQQMSFGRKTNTMALKLGQHCESYFINKYGRCDKKVIEFPSYHKTQVLGAEKTLTKTKTGRVSYKTLGDRERKKWSTEQCFYILTLREDFETICELGLRKKKDDVSDCVLQLQAFKYLYFVDKVEL